MALQYHQTMYARFPDLIKEAAVETLRQFQQTADATLASTKELAKAELVEAVSTTARVIARHTATKLAAIWIAACLLACCLTFGSFGWYVHRNAYVAGYAKGYGKAYLDAKDEKAAAAWANTPQGKAAYRLAQAGSLDSLVKCDQPGWKAERGNCYAHATPDGTIYRWRLREQ